MRLLENYGFSKMHPKGMKTGGMGCISDFADIWGFLQMYPNKIKIGGMGCISDFADAGARGAVCAERFPAQKKVDGDTLS